jgi:hypothetical protein
MRVMATDNPADSADTVTRCRVMAGAGESEPTGTRA